MKIVQAQGQTCNQFWIYSNYIADCLQLGEKIIILAPDIPLNDYPYLLSSKVVFFPLYYNFIANLVGYKKYIKFLNKVFANRFSKKSLNIILNLLPNLHYVNASVKCPKSQYRIDQKEDLKKIFSPKNSVKQEISNLFNLIRKQYDIIVGIHIRLGDYRIYSEGKYYYEMSQYKSTMSQIKTLFPNEKITFFLASDEIIDLSNFVEYSHFIVPQSSVVKDLFALSMTDYITGPPSTFSGWAAFYGDKPIHFIEDPNRKIYLNNFKNILDIWE